MHLGGRAAAAIEVLKDMDARHRPAGEALRDWGLSHRFAGSSDRAAIGNLVYDVLRSRSSLGWIMGSDTPRLLVYGALGRLWGLDLEILKTQLAADRHSPKAPTDKECVAYRLGSLDGAPDWVKADIPEWLWPMFSEPFEDEAINEGAALTSRPPVDLRVNTLKAERDKVIRSLSADEAAPTAIARHGLRIPAGRAADRQPNVQSQTAFQKGWIEIQDEGSQVCADLVYARPGEKVLDFCAGAGGKTLALAAQMQNKGQIYAFDTDRNRFAPIHDRLKRAGTRNVQTIAGAADRLEALDGKMDRVLVDAPCTGSGVWRRRPETKWKLTAEALDRRVGEQAGILDAAQRFVRPGGYLCYITCSMLSAENEAQIQTFLERHADFALLSAGEAWEELFGIDGPKPWSADGCTVTLTPASTGTDGFFFAVLQRDPQQ